MSGCLCSIMFCCYNNNAINIYRNSFYIVPTFKIGNAWMAQNYRAISLSIVFERIFERKHRKIFPFLYPFLGLVRLPCLLLLLTSDAFAIELKTANLAAVFTIHPMDAIFQYDLIFLLYTDWKAVHRCYMLCSLYDDSRVYKTHL